MTPTFFVIDSLKTILKVEVDPTPVLLSDGEVDEMVGGVVSIPVDEFVGDGVPDEKSALLLLVSCPAVVLCAEVVLVNAAVGAVPSKQFALP
jgi:hypothetical protein